MANHKSALKRNRQSIVRREKNRQAKAALRTLVKKFNATVTREPEAAKEALAQAVPAIAKAASKGIIHKNAASRKISRLSKRLHKSSTAQGA